MGYCHLGTRSQSLSEVPPDIRLQHRGRPGGQTASSASERMVMGMEEPLGREGSAGVVVQGT